MAAGQYLAANASLASVQKVTSFPRKRETILISRYSFRFRKSKVDSRFRGNDDKFGASSLFERMV